MEAKRHSTYLGNKASAMHELRFLTVSSSAELTVSLNRLTKLKNGNINFVLTCVNSYMSHIHVHVHVIANSSNCNSMLRADLCQ